MKFRSLVDHAAYMCFEQCLSSSNMHVCQVYVYHWSRKGLYYTRHHTPYACSLGTVNSLLSEMDIFRRLEFLVDVWFNFSFYFCCKFVFSKTNLTRPESKPSRNIISLYSAWFRGPITANIIKIAVGLS